LSEKIVKNHTTGKSMPLDDLLPNGRKLFGGDDCLGVFAALDLALVGALEGGTDGDDPAWT